MHSSNLLKSLFCALIALTYVGFVGAVSPRYPPARRHGRAVEAPEITTNAERLRRGLPLLPPRSLDPSRTVLSPRNPRPSGISFSNKCIEVKKKGNSGGFPTSYISELFVSGTGSFGVTNNKDKCLEVLVPNSNGPFSLAIDGRTGPERFLGLGYRSGRNYVLPVRSEESTTSITNKNSNDGGPNGTPLSQSLVWSQDSASPGPGNKAFASWNNGGSSTQLTFWMRENPGPANDPKTIYFALNSNFRNDFNNEFEVDLTFVNPTNGNSP